MAPVYENQELFKNLVNYAVNQRGVWFTCTGLLGNPRTFVDTNGQEHTNKTYLSVMWKDHMPSAEEVIDFALTPRDDGRTPIIGIRPDMSD